MKLFIPTESDSIDTMVSNKLGRANYFYVFDSDSKEGIFYKNSFYKENHGAGVKTIEFMLKTNTEVLITPRVGEKALDLLLDTNVKIYQTNGKCVKETIEGFLKNELEELY